VAKVLEKAFNSDMNIFMDATEEELEAIDEVGPIVAKTIVRFWSDEQNAQIVNNCFELGVTLKKTEVEFDQIFTGMTFVFTGSLEQFTRKEAGEMVEARGGRSAGSVSSKTNYVVAGPGAGSKLKKASELNIPVLTEEEFLEMVQ
jgi:DNA ligase (NAD+)